METFRIAVYEKNMETGIFENIVGSYLIDENPVLIDKIYCCKEGDQRMIYLWLTIDREIDDWQYNAIYDYYDEVALEELGIKVEEEEGHYSPIWRLTFPLLPSQESMEERLNHIVNLHKKELDEVYKAIKDIQHEYEE